MSDANLNQDDIDALLSGIDAESPIGGEPAAAAPAPPAAPADDFGMTDDFGAPAAPAPAPASAHDAPAGQYSQRNIEVLMDVPLNVVVELGRTEMQIKDVLELAPGSIVELNRMAGEPINVLVNGRLVARGEVVVVDESFGIKITSIISPMERLTQLN
jgi:flagellar motor switch protein FliN